VSETETLIALEGLRARVVRVLQGVVRMLQEAVRGLRGYEEL
jgi:hypothetical protein